MCPASNTAKKYERNFYTPPPLDHVRPRSNRFRTGFDFQFELREVNQIRCRPNLRQTVGKHLTRSDLYKSHFMVVHFVVAGRTLSARRVSFWRLIIPSAAEESQQRICCDAPVCMPSQAPESAATNSASPLLSATVDCFRRSHDAVPLTLNGSASPAQSESPYVNTEPIGALFTASRLSVVGRTVMIPGFPKRYRRTDLTFLMSVSLGRPRLDEALPIAQRKSTLSIHSHFPTICRYTFLLACGQLLLACFTAFPSQYL